MSNEYKNFEVKLHCNEAFYRALVLMLRHAELLTGWGSSRNIGIFCDGDGHDKVKILSLSEPVEESRKGVLSDNSFHIDTDEVFSSIAE